jgi:hypothetical protein
MYVETTVNQTLDELSSASQPNAIVVREGTDPSDHVIACGDILGPVESGKLPVALRAVSGSNIAGVAIFDMDERGLLGLDKSASSITVFLVSNTSDAMPIGTPTTAAVEKVLLG